MIYSIVPEEVIFQGADKIQETKEISYRGQRFLAEALEQPGEFRLVQLLSSDPSMFLHPDYQPGSIIRFPASSKSN